jgi:hypothetical protein
MRKSLARFSHVRFAFRETGGNRSICKENGCTILGEAVSPLKILPFEKPPLSRE